MAEFQYLLMIYNHWMHMPEYATILKVMIFQLMTCIYKMHNRQYMRENLAILHQLMIHNSWRHSYQLLLKKNLKKMKHV